MTEPRRFQMKPTPTGRMVDHQLGLYAQGLTESYRHMPMGDISIDYQALEEKFVANYASRDVEFTLEWWRKHLTPVLVNRLTRREYVSYTEMIRPETLARMSRPLPRATAYPDYGWM